jgi:hypothetical protein
MGNQRGGKRQTRERTDRGAVASKRALRLKRTNYSMAGGTTGPKTAE